MPVTPEEWDSGVAYTPLAKGLLSFLRENSPMGYSADELFSMLPDIGRVHGFVTQIIELPAVESVLNGLATNKQIESKELKGETSSETYYRATS